MEMTQSQASGVSFEFHRILNSGLVSCDVATANDLWRPHPAIGVRLGGTEIFRIWNVGEDWFSSDFAMSLLLDDEVWGNPKSQSELVLTVSGLVLWYLYLGEGSVRELEAVSSRGHLLTSLVNHWAEVFSVASPSSATAQFAVGLWNYWENLSDTYGFPPGIDRNGELFDGMKPSSGAEIRVASESPETDEDSGHDGFILEPGTRVLSRNGHPVSREILIADWRLFRRNGVTATDALKLIRKNGKPSRQRVGLLKSKVIGDVEPYFESYSLGIEREPIIAEWLSAELPGSEPNDVLHQGVNPRHLATPDMIGDDYVIEIKVSSQPFDAVVKKYADQVQWQMHVMGVSRALLVMEDRHSEAISSIWVERNENRIEALTVAADNFLEKLDIANSIWDADVDIEEWDFFTSAEAATSVGVLLLANQDHPGLPSVFDDPIAGGVTSSSFQPSSTTRTHQVAFQDLSDESTAEPESEDSSVESESFSAGNPYRELRSRTGLSQRAFADKFGFGKMTMVYLESGMYTQVSERQQQAIEEQCREMYFDIPTFLLSEYGWDSLNDSYKSWQHRQRRTVARAHLEKIAPPFPFTHGKSPLFFLIRDNFASVQRFCKVMKVPSITVSRHLDGETVTIPGALVEAIRQASYSHGEEFLQSQKAWLLEFAAR